MTFEYFNYEYVEGLTQKLYTDLKEKYKVDDLDIEDVFTDSSLSKTELKIDYLYINLQLPEYDKEKRIFNIKKLHCFVKHNTFLLINENKYTKIDLFHKKIEDSLNRHISSKHLFYELLDFCITNMMTFMTKFREEIETTENEVFSETDERDNILEIQIIKRNLINLHSIISPLEENIQHLIQKSKYFEDNLASEKLDDTLDKVKKILNNIHNFKDHMNLITETHEAIIARNTNKTIKILTSVNILFLVPTFITSFFGMNIHFGWQSENFVIWNLLGIIGLIFLLTMWIYIIFKRRDWL